MIRSDSHHASKKPEKPMNKRFAQGTSTFEGLDMADSEQKLRRFAFNFSDGSVFYAQGKTSDEAYSCVEGVLDDMSEDDECIDEVEIFEGTPEWDSFKESFPLT